MNHLPLLSLLLIPLQTTPTRTNFNIPTPRSPPENVEDSRPVFPDPQESHVVGVSMKLRAAPSSDNVQDEAPSLQPPSHTFNPYYHYYHHPKIPLSGPPQDPVPGPEEPGERPLTDPPQNPELPQDSQLFLQPASLISAIPTSAPRPPHPYPFPYYHTRGEAKRFPPLDPEMTRSSQVHDEPNPFNPYHHYYHPQPGPPQDPDPRPEEPGELSSTNPPQNPEFTQDSQHPETGAASLTSTLLPTTTTPPHPPRPYTFHYFPHRAWDNAQRFPSLDPETTANLSEDPNSGASVRPRSSEATSFTSSPPGSPSETSPSQLPHPYPFPHYIFPHIAGGEAKRLPPLDPEMTPNLSEDQKSDTPVLPRSSQVPTSNNPFNPIEGVLYYHYYYHHPPGIPLPGLPQDPNPVPEVPVGQPLNDPSNPEFPKQQSEVFHGVNSHQFLPPRMNAASLISSLPGNPLGTSAPDAPYPPHPYPYPYFYFPHIARGEARRLPPLDPETNPNLSEDQKSDTSVHPRSSQAHHEPNPFNPFYHHHYYHHLKIPQPAPAQDPDPGPEEPGEQSSTNPPISKSLEDTEAAYFTFSPSESPPKTSAPNAPHPPHPHPFPYYYFPYIARVEARRLPHLKPEMTPILSEDQKLDSSVHPRSSQVQDKDNLDVDTEDPDKMMSLEKSNLQWVKLPILSKDDEVKADLDDGKGQSSSWIPASQPPPFPTYPPPMVPPPPEHNLLLTLITSILISTTIGCFMDPIMKLLPLRTLCFKNPPLPKILQNLHPLHLPQTLCMMFTITLYILTTTTTNISSSSLRSW
ncbi:hypothetical protein PBY51_008267 [Eleginops maclovinus]|uniref:Uncharacterized protein n=1 Tax=Eleginops maclovinus TaxID=56733 RepID=A0AAN8AIS6_ELEMC|nr:hypothetical protein PBY51_008267 [Eleginops maclovinus]